MRSIFIQNATEGNLRSISLDIPKEQLVVFTGLSGSGKSTLLVDVVFNECQRQYLEALGMQGIRKPEVERIRGASPAILISQTNNNRNPRSTIGTLTDIYTDLRMVFEKLHVRACPLCGHVMCAADCKEETEKRGDEFFVYQYCNHCGEKLNKLTRTDFSFNTKEGACPTCEGMGNVMTIDTTRAINEQLSLEQGAVDFWANKYQDYQIGVFHQALSYYDLPVPTGVPIKGYSDLQRDILLNGTASETLAQAYPVHKPPKTTSAGRFEGVLPQLWRKLAEREGDAKGLSPYFTSKECSHCQGERLADVPRAVTVNGTRLPELATLSLAHISRWMADLESTLDEQHLIVVADYLRDINTKLQRFSKVGLSYLSLDRQTITLSGGELQRVRLASTLDSELSGVIYIMDEPTAGLHPQDTAGMVAILKALRDLGNTVLVIEHDLDVMREADFIVDIGPGCGAQGGQVIASGTLEQIRATATSATGAYLREKHPSKTVFRPATTTAIKVENARKFNLQGIDVRIPQGCLTTVSGPSGSGKSTLVFKLIAQGDCSAAQNFVSGISSFCQVVEVGQSPLVRMKRSNVATYTDVYTDIRKAFAETEAAKKQGLTAKHFSFNAPGGRCERCEGLGTITSNMLFFLDREISCPVCHGRRFLDSVVDVRYCGLSIDEVLALSVQEAALFFENRPRLHRRLHLLLDVGLGYVNLGQTLTTLSGGEGMRLKLAKELFGSRKAGSTLYLLDEPTRGLHPCDVEHFLTLVERLIDAGNTVVVVEHNEYVIMQSDWVIDLGPGGGDQGGRVMFAGTPADLLASKSATARYLRK